MTEVGDDIVVEVVAWRWSMLSWLDLWNVIELLIVVLSLGVALGWLCATKAKKAREIPVVPPVESTTHTVLPLRCEYCTDRVNPQTFPYKNCSGCGASPSYHHGRCCPMKQKKGESTKRTVGTQSQCMYKRKAAKPHFHVLPEEGVGVFSDSVV